MNRSTRSSSLLVRMGFVLVAAVMLAACNSGVPTATTNSTAAGGATPGGTASPGTRPPGPLQKVIVALPTLDFGFLPTVFAAKKGFFENEGLLVETPVMRANVAVPALTSGEIQFAVAGSAIRAAHEGLPIKGVFYTYNQNTLVAVGDKTVKSYSDIAGKTIGVNAPGSSEDRIIQLLLEKQKIAVNSVSLIPLGAGGQRVTGMRAGQVNMSILNPDLAYTLEAEGFNILGTTAELSPIPWSGFAVTEDTLKNKKDMVKAWIRASVKALVYIRDHPDEAAAFAVAEFKLTPEIAKKAIEKMLPTISKDDPGGMTQEGLVTLTKEDLEALNKTGDPLAIGSRQHDMSLLREVQKELGIKCTKGYQC